MSAIGKRSNYSALFVVASLLAGSAAHADPVVPAKNEPLRPKSRVVPVPSITCLTDLRNEVLSSDAVELANQLKLAPLMARLDELRQKVDALNGVKPDVELRQDLMETNRLPFRVSG